MAIKDSAKTILCFGDSNTWGARPDADARYPRSIRWPAVLQSLLGDKYEVISEGLCGRTLVALDPEKPQRCGINALQGILESADPIDFLIIMLGTNDVKSTYNLNSEQIAEHLEQTVKLIRDLIPNTNPKADVNIDMRFERLEKAPKILIICPPPVINPSTNDLDERMKRGIAIFKTLPKLYKKVAEKYNCGFINAGDYISSSKTDGYHLDPESHLKLAGVIKSWIQE